MIVVYLVVFLTPVVGFSTVGAVVKLRERRVLAAGFRHGRALNTVRPPMPIEPMPVLRVEAA